MANKTVTVSLRLDPQELTALQEHVQSLPYNPSVAGFIRWLIQQELNRITKK